MRGNVSQWSVLKMKTTTTTTTKEHETKTTGSNTTRLWGKIKKKAHGSFESYINKSQTITMVKYEKLLLNSY